MTKIKELIKYYYEKYKSQFLYIFFGAITTFINIISYYVCFNVLGISNVVSTIIAWVFAVIFAFITNKICKDSLLAHAHIQLQTHRDTHTHWHYLFHPVCPFKEELDI